MSIPSAWQFALLALGAMRITRLAGWDEFPLAAKVRAWVIGEHWVPVTYDDSDVRESLHHSPAPEKVEGTGRVDAAALGLPGKQPSSEVSDVRPAYRRPMLAHLVHCPWCIGAWISLAVYVAWLAAPRGTLYAMTPFALSGVVGLIAKNLDP